MIRKLFIFAMFAILGASSLFAQKPITVAVTRVLDSPGLSQGGDRSTRTLVNEYLKSELATHAGINIADSIKTQEAEEATAFIEGKAVSPDEIKKFCKTAKAQILCIISTPRVGKDLTLLVSVYRGEDASLMGTLSATPLRLSQADDLCNAMAKKVAVIIRGENKLDNFRDIVTKPPKELLDPNDDDNMRGVADTGLSEKEEAAEEVKRPLPPITVTLPKATEEAK